MTKRTVLLLGVMVFVMNLMACGQFSVNEEPESNTSSSETEISQTKEEEIEEEKVEVSEEELPYWRGVWDYFGYRVIGVGDISLDIAYPSLTPTSWGWAYQMDPTYVFVTSAGYDEEGNDIMIDSLEETFEVSKTYICRQLDFDRSYHYDNFDFSIETQEPVTINDLSMYKYTGIHTYTYDGEQRECDFVAYSVDPQQIEHQYITLIVMDDSLSHPSMDPVPEGTIEAYARKMAESISVRE